MTDEFDRSRPLGTGSLSALALIVAIGVATLTAAPARAALKRLQCPFTMKDKQGKTAGSICFDGKN